MPDFGHLKRLIVNPNTAVPFDMPEIIFPGQPEGAMPRLFVVTTGEKNVEFSRAVAGVAIQQAKQRQSMTAEESLRRIKERRARFRKLAPTMVVRKWENVYARGADGKPVEVPFTVENCVELFFPEDHVDDKGMPAPGISDDSVDRLMAFCADETNFTAAANPEVIAKN